MAGGASVSDFESLDWFTDPHVHQDPFPYYEYLRANGPIIRFPRYNVVAVTDYEEILKTYWDNERYSSVIASGGPLPPIPFVPEGEDITEQIEANRYRMPRASLLVAMDPPLHGEHKSLLMGIMTPRRFNENEDFIWRLVARQLDAVLERGRFETIADFAHPLSVLVVSDLLGVPESEHPRMLTMMPAQSGYLGKPLTMHDPHAELAAAFTEFIVDRRNKPRSDALSQLANAKFPDGSTPEVGEIVYLASVMFSAGQDATTRLIATSLRILGDGPGLQEMLRKAPERLPAFIEEALRLDPPSKVSFRMAKVPTRICDVDIAPGMIVMLMTAAASRDPERFERPDEFIMDRPNVHEHFAFGRGAHTCIGAPLTRAEVRIALQRLLERTTDIRISETMHGPLDARRYEYIPRYTTRGLKELHVEVALP
jgi:cytochrome P450